MKKNLILSVCAIVVVGLFSKASAQVSVKVSATLLAIDLSESPRLAPGHSWSYRFQCAGCKGSAVPLETLDPDDGFSMFVGSTGGAVHLSVTECWDAKNGDVGAKPLIPSRLITEATSINVPRPPTAPAISIQLKNEGRMPVDVRFTLFRRMNSPELAAAAKELIEDAIRPLQASHALPFFNIYVRPCGFRNAFSTRDVVICTELVSDLLGNGLGDALLPILFHELAHSLLFLWNLPGFDNEDLADEFAAVLLGNINPESIDAYIKWLEGHDSVREAVIQITEGDRHTISIQRARNMKAALAKQDDLRRRWVNLLKPFRRKVVGR
jgi:hypothetical protein